MVAIGNHDCTKQTRYFMMFLLHLNSPKIRPDKRLSKHDALLVADSNRCVSAVVPCSKYDQIASILDHKDLVSWQ